MRRFWCECGQSLFFDSTQCNSCGKSVGYDPIHDDMVTLGSSGQIDLLYPGFGEFQLCKNGLDHGVCNWVVPAELSESFCLGCGFNRTIPDLSIEENLKRWERFEKAKKRLLYSIYRLDLPIVSGWLNDQRGLLFDFIEDQRSNPVLLESYVSTGYLSGVITINAMEADNARREETRELLNESYRTLLGHLRHESGHYYYGFLNDDPVQRASFVELFGDPSQDYQRALEKHYSDGPTPDWQQSYISSYASSHPLEDWAECWSHYLHMTDTLETAMNYNIVKGDLYLADFAETTGQWKEFAVALNELNRSMGLADAYPFVINAEVERKLAFVGQTISWLRQNFPTAATH